MTLEARKRGIRAVRLRLGEFGAGSVEQWCDRQGVDTAMFVRQAILYYLSDREAGRREWRYPRFMLRQKNGAAGVRVELADEVARAAEDEARAQGVPLERLLKHATLYY